jgi:hypothetical protein
MTLLATLYPAYSGMDFDIETALEAPKRLVLNWEQAVKWANEELREGRDASLEWEYREFINGTRRGGWWRTECNEYGDTEEWILYVEEVRSF